MVLDAFIEELGDWLRDVRAERRAERDRDIAEHSNRAARILYDASVLIASMQAYNNTARLAYSNAYRYASQGQAHDEDPAIREARRSAYRRLEEFEDLHVLYSQAERAKQSLRGDSSSMLAPSAEVALHQLLDCGDRFREITRDVRDRKSRQAHRRLLGDMGGEYGRVLVSSAPSSDVARYARTMLSRIRPLLELLDEANSAYGRLCGSIRNDYHLPPPPALLL
jgi:hypothetical protein